MLRLRSLISILSAIVLVTAWVGMAVAQDQKNPMSKIADGVYHFWAMGYSSLVVTGQNGVLIVDPAFTHRANLLRAAVQKMTDKPVTKVVLSHEHYDHAGGTDVFPQAEVICQRACEAMFKLDVMGVAPKKVHQTFDDHLSIDLGSHNVDLYHFAPGDGRASTIIHLAKEKIVASADLYQSRTFTNSAFQQNASFLGIRKILGKLVEMNPNYAISAHDPGNSVEALRENAQMFNDLYAAVRAELDKAIAAEGPAAVWGVLFKLPGQLHLDPYKSWKDYDKFFSSSVQRMILGIIHGE